MKKFWNIFGVVFLLAFIAIVTRQFVEFLVPTPDWMKVDKPTYTSGLTQDYVRDGAGCIAYRVHTDTPLAELSNDQLIAVYHDIIHGDDYYLHTVWFYDDESLIHTGGFYDACVEEVTYNELEVTRR